ncbi:MAG: MscL family protein [Nitrososphaerota archaeon]|nr:MscL family protein [Nitrososphaerota archaeon]
METNDSDAVLLELRKIGATLATAFPAPPPPPKGLKEEFMAFLGKAGVLGLAVGFIMGTYMGKLVSALVSDIILPIPGALEPSGNWQAAVISIPVANGIHFLVGDFVSAVVTFLIVAVVVFFIARYATKAGLK